MNGARYGFRVTSRPYDGPTVELSNYKLATGIKNRRTVQEQIQEEIDNGRYIKVDTPPTIVSALGAIPKPDSNRVRLIHDCSRPVGSAVNDFADISPFKYQSLQDAIDLITPNCFLAKIDLKSAYRSVRTHPADHHLLGLSWEFSRGQKQYLVDTRLPFGSRLAPGIFNELSQAVRRMMERRGHQVVAYLDDYLCIGESYEDCLSCVNVLCGLLRRLGFAINYSKVEGPAQRITFLGITLDTVTQTVELPQRKLSELYDTLLDMYSRPKVTKRQLQSLAGKLNWATQCVYGGRYHLRRIIDSYRDLKKPWHFTRSTAAMRADINWWLQFLPHFNGRTPMVDRRPATPVCVDACNTAAGGYHAGQWFYLPWEAWGEANPLHINFKEVLALEPAARIWAPIWRDKKVYVHSDNQAAVAILNKGSSKNPVVMASLRRLYMLSAMYNFRLSAVYYPGSRNQIADAASRLHEPGGCSRLEAALYSAAR